MRTKLKPLDRVRYKAPSGRKSSETQQQKRRNPNGSICKEGSREASQGDRANDYRGMSNTTSTDAAKALAHPEDTCGKCGGKNGPWFASNEIWNKATKNASGILCPVCFFALAKEAGIECHWHISPENIEHSEEAQAAMPSLTPYEAAAKSLREENTELKRANELNKINIALGAATLEQRTNEANLVVAELARLTKERDQARVRSVEFEKQVLAQGSASWMEVQKDLLKSNHPTRLAPKGTG